MPESEVIFYIVKLVLGGITAFLAILLLSRTRDCVWLCLSCASVTGYAGLVYEMVCKIGVASDVTLTTAEIPVFTLLFEAVPAAFVIAAFIVMIVRSGK